MRLFVIALMLLMLPLRGWMGDAMAIGMLGTAGMQSLAAQAAPADHKASGAAHEDCAGLSMAFAPAGAPGAEGTQGSMTDCESCAVCQACNMVAFAALSGAVQTIALPRFSPLGLQPHFASAHLRRGVKPPIS